MRMRDAILSERPDWWTTPMRLLVFALAATSIACLLIEFYGIASMRAFTFAVFVPATVALVGLTIFDFCVGNRHLARLVLLGASAGLIASVAYDIFRLPFVFARQWHIAGIIPPMPLFKVFPLFGAMIVPGASPVTMHLVGWIYHFSNGITFGIMYLALIGNPTRRTWWWGIVMAVAIEIALLVSPYTRVFSIPMTGTFVIVTLAAHVLFGATMGLASRAMARSHLAHA